MHYHDPDRPRSAGGLPQFLPPGWGIVPGLELRFHEPETVEVSGWFLTSPTSASHRSKTIPYIALQIWTDAWLKDPELMAMTEFDYSGPRAAEPPRASGATGATGAPSLEDLDL